jgi:type I restriction enzyme S subunit
MSRYPAYPEYKPTRCDWFPEIPSHWEIDRAKWSVTACQNGVWGAEPDGDDDLVCIRVADFDRQSLRVSTEKLTMRSIAEKDRRNRLLKTGDLLLEKSGGGEHQLVGAVIEFNQPFPAVSSNFIARMVASDDMNSRFLVYLHSHLYSGRVNFRSIKQTTGIQNLDSQAYLDEPITYPPLEEQEAIARFLDFKTAQIDALIAKQKTLLDKLAEKRTALISHAVTKGLDPAVLMKDSEVPWLGKVPSHWKIDRAKWSVTACQNGVWGAEPDGDDDLVCIRVADFDRQSLRVSTEKLTMRSIAEKDRRNRLLKTGDLLLEKSGGGEHQLVGAVIEFNQPFPAVSSNFIARMVASDDMNSRFLVYLHSHLYSGRVNFRSIKQTTGIQNLDSQAYLDEPITYPPLEEQEAIASFLDEYSVRIDVQKTLITEVISRLMEYRLTLITNAVTGKIDVRDFEIPQSAEGLVS